MLTTDFDEPLLTILQTYFNSFEVKEYNEENNDSDPLMDVFGITPELKRQNRQYWGRELGMCWQLLTTELCRKTCKNFNPSVRVGSDEPGDFFLGTDAIDTKYRIGSGDSGTLKKFKSYGKNFVAQGYQPVLLIVRGDNLPAAITACLVGKWKIYTGDSTFEYLKEKTGFDLKQWLVLQKDIGRLRVQRK